MSDNSLLLSIIRRLQFENEKSLEEWCYEWDGHYNDQSAPAYHHLRSENSTLQLIEQIILGDRRDPDNVIVLPVIQGKVVDRRHRNLFDEETEFSFPSVTKNFHEDEIVYQPKCKEPLHDHHDGCPSCDNDEIPEAVEACDKYFPKSWKGEES